MTKKLGKKVTDTVTQNYGETKLESIRESRVEVSMLSGYPI